jgi:epsilon-lactone hydrolase
MGMSLQARILKICLRMGRRIVNNRQVADVNPTSTLETVGRLFGTTGKTRSTSMTVGPIHGEWIEPTHASTDLRILYIHGGAYVAGSIGTHRSLAANVALAANAKVFLIDYRLAPRYPYPAALDDVVAGFKWLVQTECPPAKLALVGDSAGGGLVAGLLLRLRDEGEVLPAGAVCFSPWFDLTGEGESWIANARTDLILDRRGLLNAARQYLLDTDPRTSYASPVFGDLRGLPPLLLQVGSDELLLSDSIRFSNKGRDVGTQVTLEVWEGMQHVWHFAATFVPEGHRAVMRSGYFIGSLMSNRDSH